MAKATAKKGDSVKVDYTGTLDDGTTFDSSNGKAPITFKLGDGEVIPGFENGVEGMSVGQEKDITIPADQAYGEHHEKLVQKVPRDKFPQSADLKKGMLLTMKAPTGQQLMARIAELDETTATLDLNHPLAGKTLHFKVKLVAIN
ncbi:peptidylprolyl isomerase [Candidatus Woesearchaeota archaeon]|nr:peptidylprolyl isomerase [Candidatus Woesearchaeota archaeon]